MNIPTNYKKRKALFAIPESALAQIFDLGGRKERRYKTQLKKKRSDEYEIKIRMELAWRKLLDRPDFKD